PLVEPDDAVGGIGWEPGLRGIVPDFEPHMVVVLESKDRVAQPPLSYHRRSIVLSPRRRLRLHVDLANPARRRPRGVKKRSQHRREFCTIPGAPRDNLLWRSLHIISVRPRKVLVHPMH